jgi:hypothetical protein
VRASGMPSHAADNTASPTATADGVVGGHAAVHVLPPVRGQVQLRPRGRGRGILRGGPPPSDRPLYAAPIPPQSDPVLAFSPPAPAPPPPDPAAPSDASDPLDRRFNIVSLRKRSLSKANIANDDDEERGERERPNSAPDNATAQHSLPSSASDNDSTIGNEVRSLSSNPTVASVNPEVEEDPLEKMKRMRYRIASELLSTEETYVTTLQLILDSYLTPLKQKFQFNSHFYTIELLLGVNKELLSALRLRLSNWTFESQIGDAVLIFAPYLKMYSTYAMKYEVALAEFKKTISDNSKFSKEFNRLSEEAATQLSFESLVIQPIQRIPRYVTPFVSQHIPIGKILGTTSCFVI